MRAKTKREKLILPLYLSFLCIVVCIVCMARTTLALFDANQSLKVDTIKSANIFINSFMLKEAAADSNPSENAKQISAISSDGRSFKFDVEANTKYVAEVIMAGNAAQAFVCVDTPDGNFYTTQQISKFELLISQPGEIFVTVSWGAYYGENRTLFENGECLGHGTVLICTCDTKCAGGDILDTCALCTEKGYEVCSSENERIPACVCNMKCSEEDRNAECQFCISVESVSESIIAEDSADLDAAIVNKDSQKYLSECQGTISMPAISESGSNEVTSMLGQIENGAMMVPGLSNQNTIKPINPSEGENPSSSPAPSPSPTPSPNLEPSPSSVLSPSPEPSSSPVPSPSPAPSATPAPSQSPEPSESSAPTPNSESSATPTVTETPTSVSDTPSEISTS